MRQIVCLLLLQIPPYSGNICIGSFTSYRLAYFAVLEHIFRRFQSLIFVVLVLMNVVLLKDVCKEFEFAGHVMWIAGWLIGYS